MLATVASASLRGIEGCAIAVEVHVACGLPAFTVVGLPDTSCREARDRVRAAIQTSRLSWPDQRITVNLAPSGVPKVGAGLDLAIAIGVLVASGQVPAAAVADTAFIAELGLDGSLRPVAGALPLTAAAGCPAAVTAPANAAEAALVPGRRIRSAATLAELVAALAGAARWAPPPTPTCQEIAPPEVDLAAIRGQYVARHAAEVAAAGGHHLLLVGPPGAGKTMIAKAIPGLVPPLDASDALDITAIHSAAGLPLPPGGLITAPPLRAPHHTSSMVSMVGGGTRHMRPGEISCAHGGVLFLDELGEFPAHVLDALRQPLEEGIVRVARAGAAVTFPARFLLVAATNPCPCGGRVGARATCRCTDAARHRYFRRLSGPLLDRFDLRVHVSPPTADDLFSDASEESSAAVASRVMAARGAAAQRGVGANVVIPAARADELAPLRPCARRLLVRAVEQGRLSARGVHRVRCVARTIADLDLHDGALAHDHVAVALALRAELVDEPSGPEG